MGKALREKLRVVATLVFAALVLFGSIVTPAHATAMAFGDFAPTEQTFITPCPMSGGMQHVQEDTSSDPLDKLAQVGSDMHCCPTAAIDSDERWVVFLHVPVALSQSKVFVAYAPLAHPEVDPRPPRV